MADAGVVACLVVSGDVPTRHAGFALDTPHCYQASDASFVPRTRKNGSHQPSSLGSKLIRFTLRMRELLHMLDHFPAGVSAPPSSVPTDGQRCAVTGRRGSRECRGCAALSRSPEDCRHVTDMIVAFRRVVNERPVNVHSVWTK